MPIPVSCPCGFSATVPDAYAGKTGKCKMCGLPIVIPPIVWSPAYAVDEPEPEPPSGFIAPAIDTRDDDEEDVAPPRAVPPMGRRVALVACPPVLSKPMPALVGKPPVLS